MTQEALTVEAAEQLLPAGDEAVHRCRAAIGHLLELPAATPAHIDAERLALNRRAAARLKLARYLGTLTAFCTFFFVAFLLRDWAEPLGFAVAAALGAVQIPLALRVHWQRHERELFELEQSYTPISAANRVDLAKMAGRWPETITALKRWANEGRPITDHEHCAIRRFDYHRTALEDELRAREALNEAMRGQKEKTDVGTQERALTGATSPTSVAVHAGLGSNVVGKADKVEFHITLQAQGDPDGKKR